MENRLFRRKPLLKMKFLKTLLVLIFLSAASKAALSQDKKAPLRQLYIQHDNDIFRLVDQTDQYYSFGILTGYGQILRENHWLNKAWCLLPGNSTEKKIITMDYALKGYTPNFEDDTTSAPKRPFAGVSVWQLGIQSSNSRRMLSFGLTLGVRGPLSGAEAVQDNFHRMIGIKVFEGWSSQLPNKLLYGIRSVYARGFKITSFIDVISTSELTLGNYQTHLDQRVSLRIGMLRSLSQSLMFRNHLGESFKKPEFYLSGTLIGRAVLVDTTFGKLDGVVRGPEVPNKSNLLAGYEVALHFQTNRVGLVVAHNRISSESNFSTKHSYGSIGASYSF